MPVQPAAFMASSTSSSLLGLMTAVMSFMAILAGKFSDLRQEALRAPAGARRSLLRLLRGFRRCRRFGRRARRRTRKQDTPLLTRSISVKPLHGLHQDEAAKVRRQDLSGA